MSFWTSKNAAPIQSHHFAVKFGDIDEWAVKSITMPSVEVSSQEYTVGNQVFKYPGVGKWNDVTLTIVDDKWQLEFLMQELGKQHFFNAQEASWMGDDGIRKTAKHELFFGSKPDGTKNTFFIYQYKTFARSIDAKEKEQSKFMEGAAKVFDFLGVSQPDPNVVKPVGGLPSKPIEQDTKMVANEWELVNPWIKSISFGTHDYSSEELITIEIVVSYDYAKVDRNRASPPEGSSTAYS